MLHQHLLKYFAAAGVFARGGAGRLRSLASSPTPIVRTSSMRRRINLEVEVTALNQSGATCPAPKRARFVDHASAAAGRTVRENCSVLPGSRTAERATPTGAPQRKKFPTESPRRRRDCQLAAVPPIHRAIVNEMA